jgi:hypothetical protein
MSDQFDEPRHDNASEFYDFRQDRREAQNPGQTEREFGLTRLNYRSQMGDLIIKADIEDARGVGGWMLMTSLGRK